MSPFACARLGCLFTVATLMLASPAWAQEPVPETPSSDVGADIAAPAPAQTPAVTPPAPAPFDPTLPNGPRTRPRALKYDLWVDGAVTLGLGAGLITWGFVKAGFPNRSCTICDGPGTGTNGFDDFFRSTFKANDGDTPAAISHIISYGVSPAMGFALTIGVAAADRRIREAPANALLVIQASLVAVLAKEAVTFAIRRERPEVHVLEGDAKRKEIEAQSDPFESFPGGHSASIMAITSSAAVIAAMRGYRLTPLIWVVGSSLAGFVTFLRIASDQHYMTDNLVGAAVGTVVGAAVPLVFHRPVKADATTPTAVRLQPLLTTTPVAGGRIVNVGLAF